MALLSSIRSFSFVNYIGVDDFSDRLSYQISSIILTVLSGIVVTRTYGMNAITCYMPQVFGFEKGGQLDFVDQYCLTEGTYAVGVKDFHLDGEKEDGGLSAYADRKIYYYQWVPFVLAFQAVLCCLPRLLWRLVSFDRAGTDVGRIVRLAKDAAEDSSGGENRKRMLTHIARLIERMLKRRRVQLQDEDGAAGAPRTCAPLAWTRRQLQRLLPSQLSGSFLIFTYLIIKIAYLLNAVGQLLTMKKFLQLNSTRYGLPGLQLLIDILTDHDWHNSKAFPRVGCCAIQMRSAAKANWVFAQCALPVNMINEKIYLFLWFWFVIVAVVTVISIFSWFYRLAWRLSLINFVKDYLRLADNYSELKSNKPFLDKFVKKFLSRDGAFLLKMIALNCGDMVCADVVRTMWETFLHRENFRIHVQGGAAATAIDQVCNVGPGIFSLDCGGVPSNTACVRRPMLKRQKSAPAPTSFNPDAEELQEFAAETLEDGTSSESKIAL